MNVVYWVRGAEHAELCNLSIKSVKRVDKAARIWVYTDEASASWKVDAPVCRLASGRPAMVANVDAQLVALGVIPHGEQVLFLDADTIMREPFPWNAEADLYATWRDYVGVIDGKKVRGVAESMPYNYGVVGARVGPRATEVFTWMKHRILQMADKHQHWYGNQLALADLLGQLGIGTHDVLLRWSLADQGTPLRVTVLDGDKWNFTPESNEEDLAGKGIIHCKGNRKDLMRRLAA